MKNKHISAVDILIIKFNRCTTVVINIYAVENIQGTITIPAIYDRKEN